jgi:hypothetical protein
MIYLVKVQDTAKVLGIFSREQVAINNLWHAISFFNSGRDIRSERKLQLVDRADNDDKRLFYYMDPHLVMVFVVEIVPVELDDNFEIIEDDYLPF